MIKKFSLTLAWLVPVFARTGLRLRRESQYTEGESMKQKQQAIIVVGLALILGGVGFLLLGSPQSERSQRPSQQQDHASRNFETINRHLQEADQLKALREKDAIIHSLKAPTLPPTPAPTEGFQSDPAIPLGLAYDKENLAAGVVLDLNLSAKSARADSRALSATERIERGLEKKQWLGEFESEEQKAFVREIIRRANADGWAIEIDESTLQARVKGRLKPGEVNRVPQSLEPAPSGDLGSGSRPGSR